MIHQHIKQVVECTACKRKMHAIPGWHIHFAGEIGCGGLFEPMADPPIDPLVIWCEMGCAKKEIRE